MNNLLKISLLFMFTFFSCQQASRSKVLKLAHGLDPSHPVHKAMVFMADRCNELSGGELKIDIYPSGQLGSEQQCIELLQIGSLAITKVSSAAMESFTDNFKVIGLPYIFKSSDHAFRVLEGEIGNEILAAAEPFLIRGLCFYDAGSRSFYTVSRTLNKPEDLKGLKIRVMKSPVAFSLIRAMGGAPTPIDWGELYTALQSGVVDGAENNPPSFFTSRHYEVCKHYSLTEHTTIPDVLIISLKIWNGLSEQEKEWLQQAADESVSVQRKLWADSEAESMEVFKKAGVEIIYPDKALFAEKAASVYELFKNQPLVYNLIQRIKEIE